MAKKKTEAVDKKEVKAKPKTPRKKPFNFESLAKKINDIHGMVSKVMNGSYTVQDEQNALKKCVKGLQMIRTSVFKELPPEVQYKLNYSSNPFVSTTWWRD